MAYATAAAAVGTLLAVVVALYSTTWRDWRRRPELSLDFANETEKRGLMFSYDGRDDDDDAFVFLITLRVTNRQGRRTADDVEVLLSAWWTGEDGDPYQTLDHRPLPYVDTVRDGAHVTQLSIPAGVSRRVEFLKLGPAAALRVVLGQDWVSQTKPGAIFAAPPYGEDYDHWVHDHLPYRVQLIVTARDIDAVSYTTTLSLKNGWGGEEPPPQGESGMWDITPEWGPLEKS